MPLRYDLHSHSTASDGTLAPAELVAHASRQGVNVLALTDHDTTEGLEEAFGAASRAGVALVPGVEISVTWGGGTIHILGLNIDPLHSGLQQGLAGLRALRDRRAREIGIRLEKIGVADAYEEARRLAGGGAVGRTHFARVLLERGRADSLPKVFKSYLVRGKPGYVKEQWATLEQAVDWIRKAGGQAVIAHLARYRFSATRQRQLIGEFKECGGEGLEVVSGSFTPAECHAMALLAQRFGLGATVGSDYHGPENTWLELGRTEPLPPGCAPLWKTSGWRLYEGAQGGYPLRLD
ncbi:MAG TPA: PHP domain-containing protein [Gammaproteobacteria bacterium]|nr:PHP domain-containing protein [Gammaproteobacteria bacterium]